MRLILWFTLTLVSIGFSLEFLPATYEYYPSTYIDTASDIVRSYDSSTTSYISCGSYYDFSRLPQQARCWKITDDVIDWQINPFNSHYQGLCRALTPMTLNNEPCYVVVGTSWDTDLSPRYAAIAIFDDDGIVLNHATFGYGDATDVVYGSDGYIYVSGYSEIAGSERAFVAKISPNCLVRPTWTSYVCSPYYDESHAKSLCEVELDTAGTKILVAGDCHVSYDDEVQLAALWTVNRGDGSVIQSLSPAWNNPSSWHSIIADNSSADIDVVLVGTNGGTAFGNSLDVWAAKAYGTAGWGSPFNINIQEFNNLVMYPTLAMYGNNYALAFSRFMSTSSGICLYLIDNIGAIIDSEHYLYPDASHNLGMYANNRINIICSYNDTYPNGYRDLTLIKQNTIDFILPLDSSCETGNAQSLANENTISIRHGETLSIPLRAIEQISNSNMSVFDTSGRLVDVLSPEHNADMLLYNTSLLNILSNGIYYGVIESGASDVTYVRMVKF